MEVITSNCPDCAAPIEFPSSADHVICRRCGAGFSVSRGENSITLQRITGIALNDDEALHAEIEQALADLDEQIADGKEQIEILRSREQGAALQIGCALFGIFGSVILLLALFATVARTYFGGIVFFLALFVVLGLGAARFRNKLLTREQREKLAADRIELEQGLAVLESARDRLARWRD